MREIIERANRKRGKALKSFKNQHQLPSITNARDEKKSNKKKSKNEKVEKN